MLRALNALSWAAIGFSIFGFCALLIGYTGAIEQPMQGGWNSYRVREFAPQILPYLVLLSGLVITRMRNCPRFLFYAGMTLILLSGAFLCLILCIFALRMQHLSILAVLALMIVLVGGHLAYLARRSALGASMTA